MGPEPASERKERVLLFLRFCQVLHGWSPVFDAPWELTIQLPSVGLLENRYVLGLALNEAASLVFDPADARQINLPTSFINLEALGEAEGVRGHELLVLLRESRQTFEELLEAVHQILQRLLENLRVRFPKPGILLLPNQQFGAELRIAEMKGRIRCTTLFIPCKPLVVHPARAAGEAGHLFVLSSVGFQFERKALANTHAYMILAFIKNTRLISPP